MIQISKTFLKGLVCARCGATALRKSGSQKYCSPCTAQIRAGRSKAYPRDKSRKSEKLYSIRRNAERQDRALVINNEERRHISTAFEPIALEWLVMFKYPYSAAASKNNIYRPNMHGGISMKDEAKVFKERLASYVKSAVKNENVVQAKVWIDLLVQKPSHQSDAINMIDLVCDGIKIGLGVDDRWFSIRRCDWQVVKADPLLIIGIGQEHSCDHAVCTTCGRALPLVQFAGKLKATKRYASCLDCRAPISKRLRAAAVPA